MGVSRGLVMSKGAPPSKVRQRLPALPGGSPLVHRAITERTESVEAVSAPPQSPSGAEQIGRASGCRSPMRSQKGAAARAEEDQTPDVRDARLTFYDGGRAVVFERSRPWKDWERCPDCRGEHAKCECHQPPPIWERCDECTEDVRCPEHAPRGQVSGFTWRSRIRLRRMLNRLVAWVVPLFVTCTYPADECPTPEAFGVHVKRYKAAFRRQFHDGERWRAGFVWKVEFTLRGVPHMHMLVFGADYKTFRDWHVPTWIRCIETEHPHAAYVAGRGVELVRSSVNIGAYVGKYCWGDKSYQEEGGAEWRGRRWWGVVGKGALPWAEDVGIDVPDAVAVRFIRYARRRGSIYNRRWRASLGWSRPWWQSKARKQIPGRAYPSLEYEAGTVNAWSTLLDYEGRRYAVEQGWTDSPMPDVGAGLRRMVTRAREGSTGG